MNRKLLIVGAVAFLAAASVTLFFYSLLPDTSGEGQGPERAVVVAASDLPRGAQLSLERLSVKQVPTASVPDDAFTDPASLRDQYLVAAVSAGEPILRKHLPDSAGSKIAAAIPAGMRAVTVHLEQYAGVNRMVDVGDRVDVLAADVARSAGRGGSIRVEIVLEDIEVLASDMYFENSRQGGATPNVTLLVRAEDAVKLSAADQGSSIRLSLRNPTDRAAQAN